MVDRRATASAREAAKLFQQVIDRDPAFAPAYAGLVDAYTFMSRDIPVPRVELDSASKAPLSLMRPAARAEPLSSTPCCRGPCGDGVLVLARAGLGERPEIIPARHRPQPKSHPRLYKLFNLDAYSSGKVWVKRSGSLQAALRTDPLQAGPQARPSRYNRRLDDDGTVAGALRRPASPPRSRRTRSARFSTISTTACARGRSRRRCSTKARRSPIAISTP